MEPSKIVVGPITGTLKTSVTPFNIDDDSFPVLINAYPWRGRVKRKRGTSLLTRLTQYFQSTLSIYSNNATITLNGSGVGNIITGFALNLTPNTSIIPGTLVITSSSTVVYTDPTKDGYLTPTGSLGLNTINYNTGVVTIPGEAGNSISVQYLRYANLPAMGLREARLNPTMDSLCIGFNTRKAYNILKTFPYNSYSISFYKNPISFGTYVAKSPFPTNLTFNGQDYQQFWTTNYQNAFWVTNGVPVPFTTSNIGMPFVIPTVIARTSATTVNFTVAGNNLLVGDWVFVNEITASTAADAQTINFQTGYVTTAGNTFTVTFPDAMIAASTYANGIVQYLTNKVTASLDCLKWYDGDPTNGSATSPSFTPLTGLGWVNFCPPVSRADFSIGDLPEDQYYLVGARLIFPHHDRLLFFGPVLQSSSRPPVYLQDTVLWSQNGTPFYTASFTGDPSLANTEFTPYLVPANQTATASAFWTDQTGFGGFKTLGIDTPLLTCTRNEDVLIIGSPAGSVRCVYTGNDLNPFEFYFINTELNVSSTFSAVNLGAEVFARGDRGITLTSQRQSERIDIPIIDNNMQMQLTDNGRERITAQRDFINEWIYLTYKGNQNDYTYPTQTLQYNYRENTWGLFNETYTCYGQFRRQSGLTWATIGTVYPTWSQWNVPWNAGSSTLDAPEVIAGNQQGFILFRGKGTGEASSLYIQGIDANAVITCPDHCLSEGDYIVISGMLGVTGPNGGIFSVANPGQNTFTLNPIPDTSGTYFGGGLIQRMYVPFIQTKQFPVAWGLGRKTRIGTQKYLFTTTPAGQLTLYIYLSQEANTPFNIPPDDSDESSSIIYETVVFTSYEKGVDVYNQSLMMISSGSGTSGQAQIWHRENTSLIGDVVQVGFTLDDDQMRDINFGQQFEEFELHGFILDVYPSQLLC
jgi:hypothetical protein